jgi:uncharacterized protein involved in cysteine biosynthesis
MIEAAIRAIGQLRDRALAGVLAISAAGAAIVLLGAWFGLAAVLGHVTVFGIEWLDWLARIVVGFGAIFVTLAMFGAITALIASLFVGRVSRAVERRYYPGLPPPRRQSGSEQVAMGISFLFATIALNVLALPFYALWGANIPVFLAVNGYLVGREYFEIVACRRLDRAAVARLRRANRIKIFLAGMAIALFSAVPFADLLTPVLATAFMVHIFQSALSRALGASPCGSGLIGVADTGVSVIREV